MPDVSVIIPVYNAEKRLARTLDSVFDQTFTNFELICVDDGSSDNSLQILKDYAQKYKNMVIISQENKRVSAARNAGLNAAKGKYIQFFDADDIIEKDALELTYKKAIETNADMVIFCHRRIVNDKLCSDNISQMNNYLRTQKYNLILPFTFYVWDKLFKKEFLIDNKIFFNEDIVASEDGYYMLTCLSKKPKLEFVPKILYSYIDSENSSTNRLNWTGHSVDTFYDILNSDMYNESDDDFKVFVINKYLYSIRYWYNAQKLKQYKHSNKRKIKKLFKYLNTHVKKEIINNSALPNIEKEFASSDNKIFKFEEKNGRKRICFLGIKITYGGKKHGKCC